MVLSVMCLSNTSQLDVELRTKIKRIKPSIEKEDFKLVKIDKELDELKMERRQSRKRTASAREEAEVVVEDMERLEQEKELLMEEIMKKKSELDCFKKLLSQHLAISQREKEVLQESIKLKENELQEAKAKLQEKEKQLEKYKEKIQKLKKRIEEGVRELGIRDGRITELEKDKARAVAALESERMKVRVHFLRCRGHYVLALRFQLCVFHECSMTVSSSSNFVSCRGSDIMRPVFGPCFHEVPSKDVATTVMLHSRDTQC